MSRYLYRLGHLVVRRAWLVVMAWVLVLGLVGAGAATLRKPFTSDITIPGTEFQTVLDDLKSSSPSAARGSGTVVLSTTEGTPFTPVQKQAIKDTLKAWSELDGVHKVDNPFSTQRKLDDSRDDVKDGKKKIADGKKKIAKNEKKLKDSRKDVAKGRKTLEKNAKQISSGTAQLQAGQAELSSNQKTLDTNRSKLADGESQLDAGRNKVATNRTKLSEGQAELTDGQRQLDEAKAELATGQKARTQIDAALQQLQEAIRALPADDPKLPALQEQLTKLQAQSKLVPSAADLQAGAEKLAAQQAKLTKNQAELDKGAAELDTGAEQLESSAKKLADGQAQLEDGQAKLNAGQSELDLNQIKLASGAAQIEQARLQLDAAEKKIDKGEAELDKAKDKLADSEDDLVRGERRLALLNGLRAVSQDQTVAVTSVVFDDPLSAVSTTTKEALPEHAEALAAAGVRVDYSSDVLPRASVEGGTEAAGLAVAAVVLLVMLGSLLAAGLPLLISLVGVGTGLLGVLTVTHWVTMTNVTPVLALMLGLAVGIDYALFLVHRHRQQLLQGTELKESVARATGTAGGAVLFAGMTVVIALAALTLTKVPFLGVMGLAGAGTVAAAILVNLTLTPALLALIGLRVLPRRAQRALAAGNVPATAGEQAGASSARHAAPARRPRRGWGGLVTRHPLVTVLLTTVLLGAVAVPALSLKLGLPDGSSEPHDSTAYQAYTKVSDAFGAGQNAAVIAVAKVDKDEARRLTKDDATDLQLDIAEDLKDTPDVRYVVPASVSKDHRTMVFQIVPSSGPNDDATVALVHQLRVDRTEIIDKTPLDSLGFAGQTVANIDISERLAEALPVYLGVVVGISLVLLLLVFRSIAVPLLATAGFLLSMAAAIGGVVAVYQWGWLRSLFGVEQPGLILSFLPTLAIGILFGLAMDYQMFLVSGMREAWAHGEPARQAVQSGFDLGKRVVTAAALIMTSVFASFIFSDQTMIKPIGFVLAAGVLIDAFLIRMTLMPALMHLIGEKAWSLPGWLDRRLPELDIEGTTLVSELESRGGVTSPSGPEPRQAPAATQPVPIPDSAWARPTESAPVGEGGDGDSSAPETDRPTASPGSQEPAPEAETAPTSDDGSTLEPAQTHHDDGAARDEPEAPGPTRRDDAG